MNNVNLKVPNDYKSVIYAYINDVPMLFLFSSILRIVRIIYFTKLLYVIKFVFNVKIKCILDSVCSSLNFEPARIY